MVAKLAEKCANSLKTAQAQMRTFGFGGSVTVTGSVLGLSVSMGLEIEVESEEGEIAIDEKAKQEIAENRKELQENSVQFSTASARDLALYVRYPIVYILMCQITLL